MRHVNAASLRPCALSSLLRGSVRPPSPRRRHLRRPSGWAAAQGIDFHRPLTSSAYLEHVHAQLRAQVPFFDADRFFAPDIEAARMMVLDGVLSASCQHLFTALHQ